MAIRIFHPECTEHHVIICNKKQYLGEICYCLDSLAGCPVRSEFIIGKIAIEDAIFP
jgi:hypothetical protein